MRVSTLLGLQNSGWTGRWRQCPHIQPSTLHSCGMDVLKDMNVLFCLHISEGCEIDARSHDGTTPLMQACHFGCVTAARSLLDAGAEVDLVSLFGKAALHLAAAQCHLVIVELLLERRADPNVKDADGCVPLMLALENRDDQARSLPVIECLLKHQTVESTMSIQDNGFSTLMTAVIHDKFEEATLMLEKVPQVDKKVFVDASATLNLDAAGDDDQGINVFDLLLQKRHPHVPIVMFFTKVLEERAKHIASEGGAASPLVRDLSYSILSAALQQDFPMKTLKLLHDQSRCPTEKLRMGPVHPIRASLRVNNVSFAEFLLAEKSPFVQSESYQDYECDCKPTPGRECYDYAGLLYDVLEDVFGAVSPNPQWCQVAKDMIKCGWASLETPREVVPPMLGLLRSTKYDSAVHRAVAEMCEFLKLYMPPVPPEAKEKFSCHCLLNASPAVLFHCIKIGLVLAEDLAPAATSLYVHYTNHILRGLSELQWKNLTVVASFLPDQRNVILTALTSIAEAAEALTGEDAVPDMSAAEMNILRRDLTNKCRMIWRKESAVHRVPRLTDLCRSRVRRHLWSLGRLSEMSVKELLQPKVISDILLFQDMDYSMISVSSYRAVE